MHPITSVLFTVFSDTSRTDTKASLKQRYVETGILYRLNEGAYYKQK